MQDVRTKSGVKIEVERIGVYRYLHYINEMSITYDDPEKGSTTVEGYSGLFYALPDPNLYTESITAQLAKGIDEAEIGENFLGLVIGMLYCFGEMIDKNYITNLLTPSAMALKLEKRTTTKKGKTTTTFTYRVYHTGTGIHPYAYMTYDEIQQIVFFSFPFRCFPVHRSFGRSILAISHGNR